MPTRILLILACICMAVFLNSTTVLGSSFQVQRDDTTVDVDNSPAMVGRDRETFAPLRGGLYSRHEASSKNILYVVVVYIYIIKIYRDA